MRSFVLREGRLTDGQQRALQTLWPRYGIDLAPQAGPLDLASLFQRQAPTFLEIGFGAGESLAGMAAAHPERNCLGIELHRPGIGRLLLQLERQGLDNVRVIHADALEVLERHLADASLDGVSIFFPDPWPKRRHHKRRLVNPAPVALLAARLKPSGVLRLATDWADYARHMLRVLEATAGLQNLAGPGGFMPRPDDRPLTRFESRGQRLGHQVWDLAFHRV